MSEENSTRKKTWKDNYLVQAWLILLMAALYSAVLILVQLSWGPRIDENRRLATYSQIPTLVNNLKVDKVAKQELKKDDDNKIVVYQCSDEKEKPLCWVLPVSEDKFSDSVDLLLSLDKSASKLDGLVVVDKILEKDGKSVVAYQCFDAQKNPKGWVLPASGQGFADVVDLLIGLDSSATKLTGLVVINQKETPGLGNLIKEDDFRNQFKEAAADKAFTVVKNKGDSPDMNEINACTTGATISSQSVCDIVNSTLKTWREELK